MLFKATDGKGGEEDSDEEAGFEDGSRKEKTGMGHNVQSDHQRGLLKSAVGQGQQMHLRTNGQETNVHQWPRSPNNHVR